MKPVPLWRRMAQRPEWERGDPPRISDFDPLAPLYAAGNRIRLSIDRTADILDRLEDLDRARVEQERAARRKRLDR
jgi:hypothetical protein